jgi:hypothetical protein
LFLLAKNLFTDKSIELEQRSLYRYYNTFYGDGKQILGRGRTLFYGEGEHIGSPLQNAGFVGADLCVCPIDSEVEAYEPLPK